MRQQIITDSRSQEERKVTFIKVVETLKSGEEVEHEMQLRHALQAMRVSNKFKLAKGVELPKGISVNMVPPGTTQSDVEAFEKRRGQIGTLKKTNFDSVLDALERGIDISDTEGLGVDPNAKTGAMMDEDAPDGYKPVGVDLDPPDSAKVKQNKKELEKRAVKEHPELKDIDKKELDFSQPKVNKQRHTKTELRRMNIDNLQALALSQPNLTDKMKAGLMKAKKESLIDSIIQLSKIQKK